MNLIPLKTNNTRMNLEHLMMSESEVLKKDGACQKGTEANLKELTLARANDSIGL